MTNLPSDSTRACICLGLQNSGWPVALEASEKPLLAIARTSVPRAFFRSGARFFFLPPDDGGGGGDDDDDDDGGGGGDDDDDDDGEASRIVNPRVS